MDLKEKVKEVLESPMLFEKIAEEIRKDNSGRIPESLKSQPKESLVEVAKTIVKDMPEDKLIRIIEKASRNENK